MAIMSAIDDYLMNLAPEEKAELERLRSVAKSVLPESEDAISYGMPTIKYKGKPVLGFDAHKNHIGIYPFSGSVISKIPELSKYKQTPGAIRENLSDLLPEDLIKKMVTVRLQQIIREA